MTNNNKRHLILCIASLIIAVSTVAKCHAISADQCREPSSEKRSQILKYIGAQNHVPSIDQLVLLDSEPASPTCFWKLEYELGLGHRKVVYYLSPDQSYLTTELFDLKLDPLTAEKARTSEINRALIAGKSASKGSDKPRIYIVEFSDFECPYCRRMSEVLTRVMASSGSADMQVVFHEFPLSMHAWAKSAAELAECVRLQSPSSFWKVHDYLFQNQQLVNENNLRGKVLDSLHDDSLVNIPQFNECADEDLTLGPVQKDIALGEKYGVRATPTMFINGVRIQGFKSEDELQKIIKAAADGNIQDTDTVANKSKTASGTPTQCVSSSGNRVALIRPSFQ